MPFELNNLIQTMAKLPATKRLNPSTYALVMLTLNVIKEFPSLMGLFKDIKDDRAKPSDEPTFQMLRSFIALAIKCAATRQVIDGNDAALKDAQEEVEKLINQAGLFADPTPEALAAQQTINELVGKNTQLTSAIATIVEQAETAITDYREKMQSIFKDYADQIATRLHLTSEEQTKFTSSGESPRGILLEILSPLTPRLKLEKNVRLNDLTADQLTAILKDQLGFKNLSLFELKTLRAVVTHLTSEAGPLPEFDSIKKQFTAVKDLLNKEEKAETALNQETRNNRDKLASELTQTKNQAQALPPVDISAAKSAAEKITQEQTQQPE